METLILVAAGIIIGFFLYKWISRSRKKRLKKKLKEYRHNLNTIAKLTGDYNERLDAISKIKQCDHDIKELEDKGY